MLRHRVSRETLCPLGQPEKVIGDESQIEPWLALHNHSACLRQKPRTSLRHDDESGEKWNHSASSQHQGWMTRSLPVAGDVFFLTSPFIERDFR